VHQHTAIPHSSLYTESDLISILFPSEHNKRSRTLELLFHCRVTAFASFGNVLIFYISDNISLSMNVLALIIVGENFESTSVKLGTNFVRS